MYILLRRCLGGTWYSSPQLSALTAVPHGSLAFFILGLAWGSCCRLQAITVRCLNGMVHRGIGLRGAWSQPLSAVLPFARTLKLIRAQIGVPYVFQAHVGEIELVLTLVRYPFWNSSQVEHVGCCSSISRALALPLRETFGILCMEKFPSTGELGGSSWTYVQQQT